MPFFESAEDKALREKIASEEKSKFERKKRKAKEVQIRKEEKAKLESGGVLGFVKKEGKKFLKDAL